MIPTLFSVNPTPINRNVIQLRKIKIVRCFTMMTDWRQFRMPSWNVIQKVMTGNVVVDGRNIYDRQELEEQGFVYTRIGE